MNEIHGVLSLSTILSRLYSLESCNTSLFLILGRHGGNRGWGSFPLLYLHNYWCLCSVTLHTVSLSCYKDVRIIRCSLNMLNSSQESLRLSVIISGAIFCGLLYVNELYLHAWKHILIAANSAHLWAIKRLDAMGFEVQDMRESR